MSECMMYFGSISYNSNRAIVGYDKLYLYTFSYRSSKYQKIQITQIQNVFTFDNHDYVYVINSSGLKIYCFEDDKIVYSWNRKHISSLTVTDTCININGNIMMMHDSKFICKQNIIDGGSNDSYTWLYYSNNKLEIIYKQTDNLETYYNVTSVSSLRDAIYFSDYYHHYRLINNQVSSYLRLESDSDVMSGGVIIRNKQRYYLEPLSLEAVSLDNIVNTFDGYKYLLFQDDSGINIVDSNYGFVIGFIPSVTLQTKYQFLPTYLNIDGVSYSYSGSNISSHKFCEHKDNSYYYNINFPSD